MSYHIVMGFGFVPHVQTKKNIGIMYGLVRGYFWAKNMFYPSFTDVLCNCSLFCL